MQSNLPWSSPLCHPFSVSVVLVQSHRAYLFCWAVLCRMNLFYVQVIKSLGDEKKLSINILCPKPVTLQVKCLTVTCVAVMSSVAECKSLPKYALMSFIPWFIIEFVNFDTKTFSFHWNVLPEMFSVSDFIMSNNSRTETSGQTDWRTWRALYECSLCAVHRKHFTL